MVHCDLSDPTDISRNASVLKSCPGVVHLAGYVPQSRVDDTPAIVNGNIVATANLLEAIRSDALVILASTTETYSLPIESPISESHQQAPPTVYGASKVAAEEDRQCVRSGAWVQGHRTAVRVDLRSG